MAQLELEDHSVLLVQMDLAALAVSQDPRAHLVVLPPTLLMVYRDRQVIKAKQALRA